MKRKTKNFDALIVQELVDVRSMLDNNTMRLDSVGKLSDVERQMYHRASDYISHAVTTLEFLCQVKEVNL